jgi:hypothetical protein
MGYTDGGYQNGNLGMYVGPYAGAPVVAVGELQFRFKPGVTIMVPEVAMNAGTKQYEFYGVESYGSGGALGKNADALALTTSWVSVDIDNIQLADGSDRIDVFLTPTDVNDALLYRVSYWIPTPTKIAIVAEILDPAKGLVLNDPANQLSVHHHRFLCGDNVVTSTFNGRTYKWADWIPAIASQQMTVTGPGYTSFGWNFRPNAAGDIELRGDCVGVNETMVFNLTFTKIPSASLTRFGTFN